MRRMGGPHLPSGGRVARVRRDARFPVRIVSQHRAWSRSVLRATQRVLDSSAPWSNLEAA